MQNLSVQQQAAELQHSVEELKKKVHEAFTLESTQQYVTKISDELRALIHNLEEGAEKILEHTDDLYQLSNELDEEEKMKLAFHTTSICEAACIYELSCQRITKVIYLLNEVFEIIAFLEGRHTQGDKENAIGENIESSKPATLQGPPLPENVIPQSEVDSIFG